MKISAAAEEVAAEDRSPSFSILSRSTRDLRVRFSFCKRPSANTQNQNATSVLKVRIFNVSLSRWNEFIVPAHHDMDTPV